MQVKKSDEDGNFTAEPLEVDGKPVTAETTFTPETASGEVEVTFTFDSRAIADKTDIVVFESLERTGVEIASHDRRPTLPRGELADAGEFAVPGVRSGRWGGVRVEAVHPLCVPGVDGERHLVVMRRVAAD